MKHLLSPMILLFLCIFHSCHVDTEPPEDEVSNEITENNFSSKNASYIRGGIYISSFKDEVLGNITEENSLLNWLMTNNTKTLHIYKMKQILYLINYSFIYISLRILKKKTYIFIKKDISPHASLIISLVEQN